MGKRFLVKKAADAFTCPPDKDQAFLWCTEPRGFGLRCTRGGFKSFVLAGTFERKERRITLGAYGDLTIAAARAIAYERRLELLAGKDRQVEKRRAEVLQVTLRTVSERYIAERRTAHGPLRPATKRDIARHVTKTFADWADKPINSITRDLCVERFDEISKNSPYAANQAMRYLAALCS